MTAMRLLILQALDDAHLYSVSARALAAALLGLGGEAEVFDPKGDAHRYVAHLAGRGFQAVISFGGFLGALARADGASIYDVLGVEFVLWGFDHPVYLSHQMLAPSGRRRCIWPNPAHVDFVREMGVDAAHVVGLAGAEPPRTAPKPWAARRTPILVAARWNGRPTRSWAELEDSPAKRLLDSLADRLVADRRASLIAAWRGACAEVGVPPQFGDEWLKLMRAALTYVRDHDRLAAITALAEAGAPLTVCGDGWEAALGAHANVRLIPGAPFSGMADFYGDARVVVNLNAGNGGCERALGAAMAGAAVVSDPSEALEAELGPALALYDRARPQTLAEAALGLLEGAGRARAAALHDAALTRSSWAVRAQGLLALLSA